MKRFFQLAVASFVMFAVSCSPGTNDDVNALLKLSSESVMTFPQEGGDGIILYTLANAKEGAKVQAVCVSEWLMITDVGDNVKFTVAPNEESEARSAIIIVSYKAQSIQVIVEQQGAPDVEFVAAKLNGKFYGKDNNSKAYQYTIVLSKYGTTGSTTHYKDDSYYHFNIYSSVPAASEPHLAWGEYVFDADSNCEPGTFSDDRSEYVKVDADGNETYLKIKSGKIVIVDRKIDALITLEDGSVHHVSYAGSLSLYFLSEVARGPYSTIEEDYIFDIKDGAMMLLYDGDDYRIGRGSWEVRFMNDASLMSGDFFRFNVVVDSVEYDDNLIYRTFTADTASTYAADTFEPGYKDNGDLYGSWYMPVNEGYFGYVASAIADGSFTVEPLADDQAMVTVEVVDDRGFKLTGKCHCKYIQSYDRTSM